MAPPDDQICSRLAIHFDTIFWLIISFLHSWYLDHRVWYHWSSLDISFSSLVFGCLIVWPGVLYKNMWISGLDSPM